MSKVVLKSLSILLGAFFIFLGVLKISPKISKDLHKDLRSEYAKYAKVFPLAKAFELKIPSKWYRRAVGGLEIICGTVMMLVPSKFLKNGANVVLVIVKMLNAYSHWAINDAFERIAPTLVFLLMLGCRLVIDWQMRGRTEEEDELELDTQQSETTTTTTSTTTATGAKRKTTSPLEAKKKN